MSSIKAVVFDCFGVLVTDGWQPFLHRYFHDLVELKSQAIESNRLVDAGLKSYHQHLEELAKTIGISLKEVYRQIENNQSNQQLFEYIAKVLRPEYKIGVLSNAGDNWLDRLFSPAEQDLFDEVVLSCDIGVTKPDSLMYQTVANRLGVLPEECLFIDDVPEYCRAAELVGMRAIVYQNPQQTIAAIEEVIHAGAA